MQDDRALGQLLLARRLVDGETLRAALVEVERRRAAGQRASLGELLVQSGRLDPRRLAELGRPGAATPVTPAPAGGPVTPQPVTSSVRSVLPGRAPGPGQVLCGCRIEGELGRGGMGVVLRARDERPGPTQGQAVALKVMLHMDGSPRRLERFRRESAAVAALDHPGIVRLLRASGEEGEVPCMVLELVAGRSLDALLAEGRLTLDQRLDLVEQVARAVGHAHERGIVHRDLKPQNVLTTGDGRAKVTDFGLARDLGRETRLTETGGFLGTPAYMAPEQVRGEKDAGPAADVYALGVLLYEAVTGEPPFVAGSAIELCNLILTGKPARPSKVAAGLGPEHDALILKAMALDATDRHPTATALAQDLARLRAGAPGLASSARRARLLLAGLAGLALVIGLAVVLAARGDAATSDPVPPAPAPVAPVPVAPPALDPEVEDLRAQLDRLEKALVALEESSGMDALPRGMLGELMGGELENIAAKVAATGERGVALNERVVACRRRLAALDAASGPAAPGLPIGAPDGPSGLDAGQAAERARVAVAAFDGARALAELEPLARSGPLSPELRLLRVQALDLTLSEQTANEAIALSNEPARVPAYEALLIVARLFFARGDRQSCYQVLTKAIAIDEARFEAYTRRGLLSLYSGQKEGPTCRDDIAMGHTLGPGSSEAVRNHALLVWDDAAGDRARYPEAERLYADALALDPQDAEALDLRAWLYRDWGKPEQERADYVAARAIFERLDDVAGHFVRRARAIVAESGGDRGKKESALIALARAAAENQRHPIATGAMGSLLLERAQAAMVANDPASGPSVEAALSHLDWSASINPLDPTVHLGRANAMLLPGPRRDGARALACFDDALALSPGLLDARLGRCMALRELKRGADAETELRALLRDAPGEQGARRLLAAVLREQGRAAEADEVERGARR